MATTFKTFSSNDVISTKTLLHEAVPLTGAIVSGTYGDLNIKNYSHGMFQSIYDYPYLSSSANHVFDVSVGYSPHSPLSGSSNRVAQNKKFNIYNQMAQVLMGFDHTGSVQRFDEDGDLLAGGTKIDSAIFLSFSRLLVKDEIKKGSFSITLGVSPYAAQRDTGLHGDGRVFDKRITLADTNAQNDFRVNSPAGEYGILYASVAQGSNVLVGDPAAGSTTVKAGLIYYQAGIAVITSSVLIRRDDHDNRDSNHSGLLHANLGAFLTGSVFGHKGVNSTTPEGFHGLVTGSNISSSCDAVRARIHNISFNNTTELNSTVYFCRANHNEFNYSANPTYLNGSKIRVKQQSTDQPVSYITTVGLYSADNELMGVAKLSEPLRKDPTNEMTLRVRLDY
tara:strand:- start:4324 stop:5505 length:1182 start_codon:yes stop_codon:yes gene_type:complete